MSISKYPPKLNDVISLLEVFENPKDRIDLLIQYSERFISVPEEISKLPYPKENKVEYCESEAYVWAKLKSDGTINIYFAIENPQGISAKALSAILDETLTGVSPQEILDIPEDIVLKLFGQKLSMGKNLGLTGILLMLKKEVKKLLKSSA